jgi:hypothetical protein
MNENASWLELAWPTCSQNNKTEREGKKYQSSRDINLMQNDEIKK